jgi:hypothetical protein
VDTSLRLKVLLKNIFQRILLMIPNKISNWLKPAVVGFALISFISPSCAQKTIGENIALHQPVTFSVAPNYSLTKDADDAAQITDGIYTKGKFWTQKTSAGWQNSSPVVITIDLGKVQPIAGISYNTAAGDAGVTWPSSILIATSDDAKTWHYAGDLVTLDKNTPPSPGYSVHRYVTHQLKAKGRYLALGVVCKPYLFTDEIEVYRGSAELLQQPQGIDSDDIKLLILYNAIQGRLRRDWQSVKSTVDAAALTPTQRQNLLTRLAALQEEMRQLPLPDIETFKAILPLNDLDAKILAVHAALLRARHLPPLVAWKAPRYAYLSPLDAPDKMPSNPPQLSVEMMRNEHRADAFLLTNTTDEPVNATITIEGAHQWLHLSPVVWTDTFYYLPVAAALQEADFSDGAYYITIPAGMTRKIWLGVDSTKLASGDYKSTLQVKGVGENLQVPLRVHVSSIAMQRSRLSLGVWDYTSGNGERAIQTKYHTLQPALALMQSHYVDSTWSEHTLPLPRAADFDANGNLTKSLDFTAFDDWLKRWPEARHYFVFLNVENSPDFAGAKMGTAEFDARVGSWAKALVAHMRSLQISPEKLALHLVDEPHHEPQGKIAAAWFKALNAAAPELTLFTDPTWARPEQVAEQESITGADIVSPELSFFAAGGDSVQKYFAERQAAGQQLWFYQVGGLVPAHTRDPSQFYRGQAWRAFQYGATGEEFWAFGDIGGTQSSWDVYLSPAIDYSPVFFETRNASASSTEPITNSLMWEATREGVEDYEYLAMLRDAAAHSDNAAWKKQAEQLLAQLPSLLGEYPSDIRWNHISNHPAFDDYRIKVLHLLEQTN